MKQPSPSQRRYFGLAVGGALLVVSATIGTSNVSIVGAWIVAAIGVSFALAYYSVPSWQLKLIAAFEKVTYPIRWIASLVALGLVYYAVLTPIAIWYRMSGRSFRDDHPGKQSNWGPVKKRTDPKSYFETY